MLKYRPRRWDYQVRAAQFDTRGRLDQGGALDWASVGTTIPGVVGYESLSKSMLNIGASDGTIKYEPLSSTLMGPSIREVHSTGRRSGPQFWRRWLRVPV